MMEASTEKVATGITGAEMIKATQNGDTLMEDTTPTLTTKMMEATMVKILMVTIGVEMLIVISTTLLMEITTPTLNIMKMEATMVKTTMVTIGLVIPKVTTFMVMKMVTTICTMT